MNVRIVFIATLFPLFATGCASKRIDASAVEREVSARSSLPVRWDQGTEADAQVRARVKELLAKDLTLDGAVEVALLNNRTLQATYERLGVAQSDLVEAGLLANPSLSGSALFPLKGGAPRLSGSVAHSFLSLLMIPARRKLARAEFEQQKLLVADEVLALAAEVKIAFVEAQSAQQVLALQRTVQDASAAGAEVARRQHIAGNLSDLQLALEEEQHEMTALDLGGAETDVFASREHLNRLMGAWGADVSWKITEPLAAIPAREAVLENLESLAIAKRLDLAAGRQEVVLLQSALGTSRRWRWFPGLEIGVEAERETDGVRLVGPTLSFELPIFDRGQGSLLRLRSQLRQSENILAARAIEIRSEVRESRDQVVRLRGRVVHYRTVVIPLRERIVALSQQRYNAMLLGVYELLRAKQNEIDTYQEFIETTRDYWVARAELERAVGGNIAPASSEGESK